MSTLKVLVSGDPQGKLGALFKRVAAVNKSNGPFDFLFCVGSFFPPSGTARRFARHGKSIEAFRNLVLCWRTRASRLISYTSSVVAYTALLRVQGVVCQSAQTHKSTAY